MPMPGVSSSQCGPPGQQWLEVDPPSLHSTFVADDTVDERGFLQCCSVATSVVLDALGGSQTLTPHRVDPPVLPCPDIQGKPESLEVDELSAHLDVLPASSVLPTIPTSSSMAVRQNALPLIVADHSPVFIGFPPGRRRGVLTR